MAEPSVANSLAKVPIFSGCSKRELAIIARASKEVVHKEGTVIAREGERGVGLFLILEGQCAITIGGKTKAKLGPGDFFGEVAMLGETGRRMAVVVATSDMRVAVMFGAEFRLMENEFPQVIERLRTEMQRRLEIAGLA